MRWLMVAVCVTASCRGAAPGELRTPQPTGARASAAQPTGAQLSAAQPLDARTSTAPDPCSKPGTWRYALIAPLYSAVDDITRDELAALLHGSSPARTLAMTAHTRNALGAAASAELAEPTDSALAGPTHEQWAIIPAHELQPQWQVITVDGKHPLGPSPIDSLTATVCGDSNIDPGALTSVAMTGVTAMARYTATLMDTKGITYPARDVEAWLGEADFVHASNEVSFTPDCEPKADRTVRAFCSREAYIDLLAALHVNIVEQSGSHLLDHGTRWLRHSIEMYEARGWHVFGGGRDQLEATRPLTLEHNGNKLAFIGCNMPRSTSETIRNGPNVGFCDLARLDWQIADLRGRGYLPIVSIQHEEVRTHAPAYTAVRDFRRLASAGAAVVFGSQAHVAHPFEVHTGAYVHYGAGNFIFDQPWTSTRDGTVDRFYFHAGKLLSVRRLHTRIEELGRPRPMSDTERSRYLRLLEVERLALSPARPEAIDLRSPSRLAPDSFLVGTVPVFVRVALPQRADEAISVTLRARPNLRTKVLVRAITDFVTAKYGVDRNRVAIR